MSIFFNATYYLQNNPDVLQAVAQGTMPSAEFHFNEFGWRETRAPNEFFDVEFYLLNNPDVLAAGVNPLTHFIEFGAAEGRSPSAVFVTFAEFDTVAYAAANPDLAAAGLTTPSQLFAHFATFGFGEARPGVQTLDGTPIDANGVPGGLVGETFTLTPEQDLFTGTDANDVFQGETSSLTAFDQIDGAAGTDTLNLVGNLGAASTAGVAISNVEIVNLVDNSATVDAALFGAAVQQLWQIDDAGDVENVGDTTTVGFRNVTLSTDVTYTGAVGNVALDNVGDGSTLWSYGEITTLNVSGSLEQDSDPAVVEELYLHDHTDDGSGDPDPETIETLNLSLSTDTYVDLVGEFSALTTFNASASTGGIEFSTDIWGDNVVSTVLTGSGADIIYFDQDYAGGGEGGVVVTIDVGAGNDDLIYAAYGFGSNTEATTASITLGDGEDLFSVVETFSNVVDASEGSFAESLITVEDFNALQDVFDISALGVTMETLINTETGAISAAATLFDALELAASFIDTLGSAAALFSYGGDAYLLHDADDNSGFSNGDGLIQIAGLSASDFNASNFVV